MAVLFTDTFPQADGQPPDSTKWALGKNPSAGGGVTVQSGAMRLATGTQGGYSGNDAVGRRVLITNPADFEIVLDFLLTGEVFPALFFRASNSSDPGAGTGYQVRLSQRDVVQNNNFTTTTIAGPNVSGFATGTWYSIRLRVIGTSIKVRTWTRSGAEPTTWNYADVTNAFKTAAGNLGVRTDGGGAAASQFFTVDNVTVTDGADAGQALTATAADNAAASDAATTVAALDRQAADTAAATDAASTAFGADWQASDTATASDAASATLAASRSAADSAAASDTVTTSLLADRATADVASFADVASAAVASARAAGDTIGVTDAATALLLVSGAATAADQLPATDTATTTAAVERSCIDTAALVDQVTADLQVAPEEYPPLVGPVAAAFTTGGATVALYTADGATSAAYITDAVTAATFVTDGIGAGTFAY